MAFIYTSCCCSSVSPTGLTGKYFMFSYSSLTNTISVSAVGVSQFQVCACLSFVNTESGDLIYTMSHHTHPWEEARCGSWRGATGHTATCACSVSEPLNSVGPRPGSYSTHKRKITALRCSSDNCALRYSYWMDSIPCDSAVLILYSHNGVNASQGLEYSSLLDVPY